MIEIRRLLELNPDLLGRVIASYDSDSILRVCVKETEQQTTFMLQQEQLSTPHHNSMQPTEESITFYTDLVEENFSLAAYDEGQMVGVALAEPRRWNRSLWLWEFHISSSHQGQGVGRILMEALAEKARATGLRIIVAEVQNTNTAAIAFYRKLGFHIEGVDTSYYSNADLEPGGEVAIF